MARPKKPEDPARNPHPCSRCAKHYPTAAQWPDGRVCTYCYRAALRTSGTCACGHIGILPGIVGGTAACRACSGVRVNIDCRRCHAEAELYSGGICWRCHLSDLVDDVFATADETIAEQLAPVAAALKAMERPSSGVTWIRQPHVRDALAQLVGNGRISHPELDRLPAGRTRDYIRGLLVEHGVLEPRDELIVRFTAWAETAKDRLSTDEHRDIIDRYLRWHHLRRMRDLSPITDGTFLRAKQATTVAIDFCNWLTAHHTTLSAVTQTDLEAWIATGPSTRLIIDRFLAWSRRSHITSQDLTVPKHRRGTARRMPQPDQQEVLADVVSGTQLSARDRLAAILVLVFAQPIERIRNLTWDDIEITDATVDLTLAAVPITLAPPLDQLVRDLAAGPGHQQTAAHPDSPWVFRGTKPGSPINAMHLRQRLRPLFSVIAGRLGTITELSRTTPIAFLAETLGYAPAVLEHHATTAGADYGTYSKLLEI